MPCTIVTAYYEIRSKFPKERYMNWASTFLRVKSPIVLFTEEQHVEWIREMRGNLPIQIIVLPFYELDTWKLYQTNWIEHYHFDPERERHSPELYAIWAQKAFFVEKAVQMNPFHTDFFFWCDIGAFRDPNVSSVVLDTFPTTQYLESNCMLFQSVGDLTTSEWIKGEDGIRGERISPTWNDVRLVGGLWGGGKEACIRWKKAYQTMLEAYFRAGRFAGKDQQVMLSAYLDEPALGKVVYCTKPYIDIWFFLEHLLSEQPEQYILNQTYLV